MNGDGILPQNWVATKLGDLFEFEYGKGLTKKNRVESGNYPVYGSNGIVGYHDEFLVEGPVLVIGRKGAAGAVSFSPISCWPIDTTYFVRENDLLFTKFSYYLLKSINLAKYEKSTAIPGLNRNDAYEETVFLPPLNEQKRIVAKIEVLFAELDAGVASLELAQAQLQTYRQALLKHAFEGKLTAQWRTANADKLEDAATLLQRIQAERQARHEAELAVWKEAVKTWEANGKPGKKPTKPRPPKDLPPLTPAELADLPQLPAGWSWTYLQEISEEVTDGDHQAPPKTDSGIPFITISDIKNNRIDFSDTRFVPRSYYQEIKSSRKPIRNDILYTVTGSFGIPCLIDFDKEFCFQRHIGLIRLMQIVSNKFIYYLLQSPFIYKQAVSVATGTAQKTVPLSGLRSFTIPIPSLMEQQEIVEQIESYLSIIDQLEQTTATALQQAEALRQSILKKAFAGQLVPQDPTDEPASALLARIRAAKP